METTDCIMCVQPALTSRERVRYFPRQLLTADDMRAEQEYFLERQRRHNRLLHGWGVVCGMEVKAPTERETNWQVTVCPGYAITPQGDEVWIAEPVRFDLRTKLQSPEPCAPQWSCPPEEQPPPDAETRKLYVAIRYVECNARPVRVHPAGCGCDEATCEYSRVRDSFELKALWRLPESHVQAKGADKPWCEAWKDALPDTQKDPDHAPWPVPPCPPCTNNPWVVLATIALPNDEKARIAGGMITFGDRRPLYSSAALQVLHVCK